MKFLRQFVALASLPLAGWVAVYLYLLHVEGTDFAETAKFIPKHIAASEVAPYFLGVELHRFPIPHTTVNLRQSICSQPQLLREMRETAKSSRYVVNLNIESDACPPTK